MNMETWRAISGFPNYEISSSGLVRNIKLGRSVSVFIGNNGYYMVNLWRDGKHYFRQMHRLLVEAFIGSPAGLTINHKNGIRSDNSLANLEVVTQAENNFHKTRILGKGRGESMGKDDDIRQIRVLLKHGVPQRDIAPLFKVVQSNISCIARRKTWAHVI